ncbi:MAG: Hpt domain-containing protein, partial [Chromatiales bacterium]|nr:Hpt domain-containing protein [Chromatiales bacterium]
MAIDMDDEILQDFLVEAGEILEQLNEQLVDLEQQPDDFDLLNAVFRGFHTIKGGAGFLNIEPLVEVCHRAEDVFNVLRQGQRNVDAHLMDAVLQVLDVVNEMFAMVQSGEDPEHADSELLETLTSLAQPDDGESEADEPEPEPEPQAEPEPEPEPVQRVTEEPNGSPAAATPEAGSDDEITEQEFEALLDQLHGPGKHGGVPAPDTEAAPAVDEDSDEITEEEFEHLLDELHGKGKFKPPVVEEKAPVTDDDITEEEFEQLLDDLHGKGK